MLNRNDQNQSNNSNNGMFDPGYKNKNTKPDDFPDLVDPTISERFSRVRLRAQRGNHRARQQLFTIYFLLISCFVAVVSLISWQTIKNTHRIQKSKNQQIVETHAKDSVKSQKARHDFTEKYNSMVSDTDNTDINVNDNTHDLEVLSSYLPKIDKRRVDPYQKKYDDISKKVKIQLQFNKFFVRNNPTNKEIKKSVTPDKVFAFNKKYNDKVQQIYDANNNDAFARRMNTDQNKLTTDATNLLSIYNSMTKLYSKLGSRDNNWSFKLNNNVIADRSQLNDDNLSMLQKMLQNKSKNLKIMSLSEITDKIKKMNYNWNNHLELVIALLNNSKDAANANYNNIAKMINQLQEEQDRKAMQDRQNELNDLLKQSNDDDQDSFSDSNSNASSDSSSSDADSSSDTTSSNTNNSNSSSSTDASNVGGNNNNGTTTDDNQQTIVLPN